MKKYWFDILAEVLLIAALLITLGLAYPLVQFGTLSNLADHSSSIVDFSKIGNNIVEIIRTAWTFILGLVGFIVLINNWNRVQTLNGNDFNWQIGLKTLFQSNNLDAWAKSESKALDVGLVAFAFALLMWSVSAVLMYLGLFFKDPIVDASLAITSIFNSMFIALALPYVQHKKENSRKIFTEYCRPNILGGISISISLIIILIYTFIRIDFPQNLNPGQQWYYIASLAGFLELGYSVAVSYLIGYSLWYAFDARGMAWEKHLTIFAITLAVLTSMMSILPQESQTQPLMFDMFEAITAMVYKGILLILFLQLGFSWEIMQRGIKLEKEVEEKVNQQEAELKQYIEDYEREKSEYINSLKQEIQLLASQPKIDLGQWNYDPRNIEILFYTKSAGEKPKIMALLFIPSLSFAHELDLNATPAQLKRLLEFATHAKAQVEEGYLTIEDGAGNFSHKQFQEFLKVICNNSLSKKFVNLLIEKNPHKVQPQYRLNIVPQNITFQGSIKPGINTSDIAPLQRILNHYGWDSG